MNERSKVAIAVHESNILCIEQQLQVLVMDLRQNVFLFSHVPQFERFICNAGLHHHPFLDIGFLSMVRECEEVIERDPIEYKV